MTDDLTRDLDALVPELDASTVLDGAARKRRRTRRRTAALAGALAIAVLTPVMMGLGSVMRSSPQPASSHSGTSAPEPDARGMYDISDLMEDQAFHPGLELMTPECQEAMAAAVHPERVPLDGLPDGATRVWLCGELETDGIRQWIGPRTPLTGHAVDAVAAINALPAGSSEAEECYGADSRRYRMVVEYATSRHVIDAHIGHCDSVGGTRSGAKELLKDLRGWFSVEREQATDVPEPPGCAFLDPYHQGQTYPLFPIAASEITRGLACGRFNNGEAEVADELSEEIVTALRDAPWHLSEDSQPLIDNRGLLVVENRHGEVLTVFRTPEGRLWIPQQGLTWTPDPIIAERLKDLFAELGHGVINANPCLNTAYSGDVDDSDIVAIHICAEFPWVPEGWPGLGSYTLPDGLTRKITEVFPAQAVPGQQDDLRPEDLVVAGAPHLLLVDSKGVGLLLLPGSDNTLVDPLNNRSWRVPDHLRIPLEGRGLLFP